MATNEEASPICRGKNLSWETVMLFYNYMPKEPMPKNLFNKYVEDNINGWTHTHSQIARQLAFYYEEDGICYPRFGRTSNLADLFDYMVHWAHNYFVPNPYTPSLNGKKPSSIYSHLIDCITNGISDFDTALDSLFGITLSSHDKVKVYLQNYTNIKFDDGVISLNENFIDKSNILVPTEKASTDSKGYFFYYGTQNSKIFKNNGNLLYSPLQRIFFGAPGTGKSFKINEEVLKGVDNSRIFRTTFHPDTDYASFVGCYKPKMEDKDISYEFVPQVFTDAYIKAWSSDEPVYLVIEEINRGNCAQIFGDLFQLLDRKNGVSEYSIKADKDLCKYLTDELGTDNEGIADGNLKLPANFNILATMNTSDQSLFPMDSAFKRRWEWEYVPIDTDHEKAKFIINIGDNEYSWPEFLKKINERIQKWTDSEDKQMGEFFIKHDVKEDEFKSKVMFYLWSEICKDNPRARKNVFMYTKDGKENDFVFNGLYGDKSLEILNGFMKYIGVAVNETK